MGPVALDATPPVEWLVLGSTLVEPVLGLFKYRSLAFAEEFYWGVGVPMLPCGYTVVLFAESSPLLAE